MTTNNSTSFDEFFSDDNFYSASITNSTNNHVNNLRNSIHIKYSASSRSIRDSLLEPNSTTTTTKAQNQANTRTSFMKASPSIKALENILNEKSKGWTNPNAAMTELKEEEEEEEDQEKDKLSSSNLLAPSFVYHNNETHSVQTFETAHESINKPEPKAHEPARRSVSTEDDFGYSTDETPVLQQPPTFQNFTPHSNNSPQLRFIETAGQVAAPKTDSSKENVNTNIAITTASSSNGKNSTNGTNKETGNKSSNWASGLNSKNTNNRDQENYSNTPRFIKMPNYPPSPPPPPPPQSYKSLVSSQLDSPVSFPPPPTMSALVSSPSAPSLTGMNASPALSNHQKYPLTNSPLYTTNNNSQNIPRVSTSTAITAQRPKQQHKQSSSSVSSQSIFSKANSTKGSNITDTPTELKKPKSMLDIPNSPREPPVTKSPHQRSNSSFSLNFKKAATYANPMDKPATPKPLNRKSQTFDDLKSFTQQQQSSSSAAPEKKKFSFKSLFKSKSKNHALNEQTREVQPPAEPKKIRSKSFSTSNIAMFNEVEEKPQKPSFINVFKKNRSSDNLAKIGSNAEKSSEPVPQPPAQTRTSKDVESFDSRPSKAHSANMIREVSDDDVRVVTDEEPTAIHEGSDEEEYDSKNLLHNPPRKLTGGNKFGEEMTFSIPPLLTDSPLGSPFQIDLDTSPRLGVVSKTPIDSLVSSGKNSPGPSGKNLEANLLGEALFPKSLNPQEVESIVTLERSMSMKSVKSKRSSFVNGNNDEHVVQYNGPVHTPGGISRSNSILKNSTSWRNNLSQELASVDGKLASANTSAVKPENAIFAASNNDSMVDDLLEFSDFIDVDNLSFSNSPKYITRPGSATPVQASPLEDRFPVQASSPLAERFPKEEKAKPIIPEIVTTDTSKDDTASPNISESQTPSPSMEHVMPKSSLEEEPEFEEKHSGLTNTITEKRDDKIEEEKKERDEKDEDSNVLEQSPILETAIRSGSAKFNNRPISMSFKGLNAPSFSGKLNQQTLRNSESHQSFTISIGDDESSSVGGGFGSSDGEDDDDDDDEDDNVSFDNEDEVFHLTQAPVPPVVARTTTPPPLPPKPRFRPGSMIPPAVKFSHNKIPSISDQSSINSASSPRSITSMMRWKKTSPVNPKMNGVRFSSRIILYDTYNEEEYDRHPDTATCNQLTPILAQQIKEELNTFKSEMDIHVESRCYTHFF
ncbi:uncharacterized protein SPAPADRAFT_64184 [Spathaspora passalidarum NRRL Y-27907]|uniref:Protein BNI4 n=1 Tax=Spathaspora passalidarum (strain NRRL Y-27907 / 11-Y1) TaxID=619300 RepID=G3AFJ4_SPAPN|nr:uncharacterized protein SPAPADRAFT_64184 [Spathaspora passalidarum NRRL Y-27907]EGW34983.1 hypothetical protein SPAPADRAFT_64184 [Spathaspora passalidarum NRRL Y-27907]